MEDIFVSDFETTTTKENCRVWGWGSCEVGNEDNVFIGKTISEYMLWCERFPSNLTVFMHNLKFDAQFIISWLCKNEFQHVTNSVDRRTKTFKTMISDKGLYYGIEVIFHRRGKNINKVTFFDSLKLLPMSVDKIARAFDMPYQKLEIDYDAHNDLPEDAPIEPNERRYIEHDIKIVARALDFFFKNGMDKITIGSCAMAEYKKSIGSSTFNRLFPCYTQNHEDIRQTYKGGYTYLEPQFADRELDRGLVLDVNSMYSSVMYDELLPFGTPIFFEGQYKPDKLFPLYVQMFRCAFELKPGKLPTVQLKSPAFNAGTEYVRSSDDQEVVMVMTSVDFEIFREHYDIYNIKYFSGWKFRGKKGMFKDYIEKWQGTKRRAKEENNGGLYLISKLFLNSLYGKFGTGITRRSKRPYLSDDGVVKYKDLKPEPQNGVYIALASFVTAYARKRVIEAGQRIKDAYAAGKSDIQFVYCDTDSVHVISPNMEIPDGFNLDEIELGAWKVEGVFRRAKYLRSKCYMQELDTGSDETKLKITVAGMPESCYEQVNFENFKIGAKYSGKMMPLLVKGGVILEDVDFTIKR